METIGNVWMWGGFAIFVVLACAVDLLVLQKKGAGLGGAGPSVVGALGVLGVGF